MLGMAALSVELAAWLHLCRLACYLWASLAALLASELSLEEASCSRDSVGWPVLQALICTKACAQPKGHTWQT